jgi:hypothetical protein
MRNLSTVRNLGKAPRVNAPKVVQIKGKGFNAGGYDPRASNNVKPVSEPRIPKAQSGATSSYLPTQGLAKGGMVQAMGNGKGKQISCKTY